MRGVGHTTLMIYNLPNERCGIVVPTASLGREIKNYIKKIRGENFDKKVHFFVISSVDDVNKLMGYSHPIFVDNSFFTEGVNVDKELTKLVFERAINSAMVCRYKDTK